MASEQSSDGPGGQEYPLPPPVEPLGPEEQARLFSEELQELEEDEEEEEEEEEEHLSAEEIIAQNARTLFGADVRVGTRRSRLRSSQGEDSNANSSDSSLLSHVAKVVLLGTPTYPMTLVQVLIQLGYEPIPPERRYSIVFQQYMYYYPGIFGYARAIVRQDGWRALYRGFGAYLTEEIVRLAAHGIFTPIVAQAVAKLPLSVVENGGDTPDTEENVETTRAVVVRGTRIFVREALMSSVVTLVSHPFHVMYVRSIAQHIGREQIYTSVWQSMKEIYREEGIAGFYSGIVPSLLGSVYAVGLYVTLWTAFELLAQNAPYQWVKLIIKGLIELPLLAYLPRTYSYPFQLMSNVMMVNNCRLAAGMPPRMPVFNGWMDCHRYLRSSKLLYRGSVVILPRFAYKVPPGSL